MAILELVLVPLAVLLGATLLSALLWWLVERLLLR